MVVDGQSKIFFTSIKQGICFSLDWIGGMCISVNGATFIVREYCYFFCLKGLYFIRFINKM